MKMEDLEEVSFFYRLHDLEYRKCMEASRTLNTKEFNAARERSRILSLRLMRAMRGHYRKVKA